MKTRLLFLFLMAFTFVNSQITINEGFESGIPATWISSNFVDNTSFACQGTHSCIFNATPTLLRAELRTPNLISTGSEMTVTVDIRRSSTVTSGTFYLQYGWTSFTNIVTSSSTSTDCLRVTSTIPAGTIPVGANVIFKMIMVSNGGTWSFFMDNFSVTENVSQIVANYAFNNSLNNAAGNSPFSSANTSFVNNRINQTTSAVKLISNSVGSSASIANLPLGGDERTVSFWHKKPTYNVPIGLFAYGTADTGKTFGLYLAANGDYVFQGFSIDHTFPLSSTGLFDVWVHSVVTFKNGIVKLYTNGTFTGSATRTLITSNSTFRLGGNGAVVEFDDLQIYNYELTAAQVGLLYANNSLSSKEFSQNNLKVALYPNPVNDMLNIETDTEIKSVEIYNLLGQKVQSAVSKQINVSNLASGIYMVRMQDENNAVETKRVIKQ